MVPILERGIGHAWFHMNSLGPEMTRGVSTLALSLEEGVCCIHPDSAVLWFMLQIGLAANEWNSFWVELNREMCSRSSPSASELQIDIQLMR